MSMGQIGVIQGLSRACRRIMSGLYRSYMSCSLNSQVSPLMTPKSSPLYQPLSGVQPIAHIGFRVCGYHPNTRKAIGNETGRSGNWDG